MNVSGRNKIVAKGKFLLLVIFILLGLSATREDRHRVDLDEVSSYFNNATLVNPVNGATNVPVNSSISWTPVQGVAGYVISLGTAPGSKDIISDRAVGLATTFTPPLGLPENTTIYVNISLFFLNAPLQPCPEESFTTEDITTPPPCTALSNPVNGQTGVPVGALLQWEGAFSAEGYIIRVGTTPGGSEITPDTDLGNTLSYNPPGDLPANSNIYVTVTPYNSNGNLSCSEESFETAEASVLPTCTSLINPVNDASGVPLSTVLEWNPVGNATGYRMTVGSTPFDDDILANADLGNVTSISFLNFVPNSFVFVTITPYNDAGLAISCPTESFTTILGCGPYLDPNTNELVFLGPELEFPEEIGLCLDLIPFTATAETEADGFRWFQIQDDGSELLVSSEATFDIFQEGDYRIEAYNIVLGSNLECAVSQDFSVVASEAPIIENVDIQSTSTGATVTISVSGDGDYEYALNNRNGPYQISPIFDIDITQSNVIYIRDRNGCGTIERFINTGIPNFFTPNGDSFNDVWQITGGKIEGLAITSIFIFDSLGKLLQQLPPGGNGWDGTYQGNPMPQNDYWYKIELENGKVLRGHFALKR